MAPLAVLAGLGVGQFYSAVKSAFPKGTSTFLAAVVMAGYFGWAAWGTYDKAWDNFFKGERVEKTVSLLVKNYSALNHVFIASYPLFVSGATQVLLDQGYDVYSLKDSNPIYLKPGESPKGAVVLMHIYDLATKAKIESQYKNASVEVINLGGWKDARPTFRMAIIPASDITEKVGDLFYFQRVPSTNWTRDFLVGRYILGYGVIEMEESVANPYAVIPPPMLGRLVNLRWSFNLPKDSQVTFKVKTNDYVKFQVDGRKLIYLDPGWTPLPGEKRVSLPAGTHQVEYDIWLQHEQAVPQVTVSLDDGPVVPIETLGQSPLGLPGH
jgi:hypothetical protein